MQRITVALAERAALLRYEDLPRDIVERARQSLLDWFAVTLGGSHEQAPLILLDAFPARARAGAGSAGDEGDGLVSVVGHRARVGMLDAALVNGTASHALDFDDVNVAMLGHPSVAVLAAALALAERDNMTVADLLTAYVAGYETACRLAVAIGPEPYMRGFHATGTVGTIGAAAACARLLRLDAEHTAIALGIAASQAAGLKCNIGTMTKSLHAGRACQSGLLSAALAARGFTASATALEDEQGFAAVSGATGGVAAEPTDPRSEWHLRENLFKYHASCFWTHSMIEGLRDLRREARVDPEEVTRVTLHVSDLELGVCATPEPSTGLEVKFSLAHLAAMVLLGRGTARITDEDADDAEVIALGSRVTLVDDLPAGEPTHVELELGDGRRLSASHDANEPERDLDRQGRRLTEKYRPLAEPILGPDRAGRLLDALTRPDPSASIRELAALSRPQRRRG